MLAAHGEGVFKARVVYISRELRERCQANQRNMLHGRLYLCVTSLRQRIAFNFTRVGRYDT